MLTETFRRGWALLFATAQYARLTERERARTIYFITTGLFVLATVMIFVLTFPDTNENLLQRATHDPSISIPLVMFYLLNGLAFWLTRLGRSGLGAVVLSLTWILSFSVASALTGLNSAATGMILITTVLLPALLLRMRGLAVGVISTFALLAVGLTIRPNLPPAMPVSAETDLLTNTLVIVIFTMLVYAFVRYAHLAREESILDAAEDRFKLSDLTAQISRRISSRLGIDQVLNNAINDIIDSYADIYHAQIFLVDEEGTRARLSASTGEAGVKLLSLQHSLEVGSKSVIGQVTATGQYVVARARSLETVHRPNEYLPDTRVEAAFPLIIGEKVIGALDLQSKDDVAFTEAEQPIFQTLADHIAIAIDNARLFEQTEKRLEENEALAQQAQQTLQDVEELNRRLTGRAWSDFLSGTESLGLNVDFEQDTVSTDRTWTPELEAAIRENALIERDADGHHVLVVPVQVRGQVIGAMEFELNTDGTLTIEDRELIQEVSQRFGLAAENARLFTESQRIAQREALINEVGARLQATSTVENTLTTAAQSLREMLNAGRVSIRLGEPPPVNGNGHKKDGVS